MGWIERVAWKHTRPHEKEIADGDLQETTQYRKAIILQLKVDNTFFNFYFFISWRLITLQYCSGFCHTLK